MVKLTLITLESEASDWSMLAATVPGHAGVAEVFMFAKARSGMKRTLVKPANLVSGSPRMKCIMRACQKTTGMFFKTALENPPP